MKTKIIVLLIFLLNIISVGYAGAADNTGTLTPYGIMSEGCVLSSESNETFCFNERISLGDDFLPFDKDGKKYFPLRFLLENMKAIVRYDSKKETVFVEHGVENIELMLHGGMIYSDSHDYKIADGILQRNDITFISQEVLEKVFSFNVSNYENFSYIGYASADDNTFSEIKRLYGIKRQSDMEYYVSPNGNDSNDGSKKAPFKTIEKAQAEVRKYLKESEQDRDITVYIENGTYILESQLLFGKKDSAENLFEIKYIGTGDEKPVIRGSRELKGWELYRGNIYRAYLGENQRCDMLFVNGKMQIKARFPNYNKENSVRGHLKNLGFDTMKQNRVKFDPEKVPHIYDCTDLELCIWGGGGTMWYNHSIDVSDIDYKNNLFCLSENVFENTRKGGLYFLQGTIELLDEPGEFCYNSKDGYIYYIPEDNTLNGKVITVPTVENVVKFGGAGDNDTVKNITLQNLELMNTHRSDDISTAIHGRGNGAGVMLSYCENIKLQNLNIHDVGDDGVYVIDYVKNCKIKNNVISNVGGGGITSLSYELRGIVIKGNEKWIEELGYPYYMGEKRNCRVKYNLIENNFINHVSIITGHGSGIDFLHNDTGYNYVQYNKVYDVRRMGIHWGFSADRDYIRYNDVSNAMNGTEDGGLIYTSFEPGSGGVAVINNYLHDANSNYTGIAGIYHDENSNGVYTRDNVVERLGANEPAFDDQHLPPLVATLQFLKGVNMMVFNNIYANCIDVYNGAILMHNSNHRPWNENDSILKNVIYNVGPNISDIRNFTEKTLKEYDYNIYYSPKTEVRYTSAANKYSDWENICDGKYEQNSLITDPMFMDAEKSDYRYKYNSPAYALGIKDINIKEAGIKGETDYNDESGIYYLYPFEEGRVGYNSVINLSSGEKSRLDFTAKTELGFEIDKNDVSVSYKSETPDIVSTDGSGNVYALAAGVGTVEITASYNGKSVSRKMNVIVDDSINDFNFIIKRTTFSKGEEIELGMYIQTVFGQKNPLSADRITLKSNDESIAVVNDKALIRILSTGHTTIVAEAELGGKCFRKEFPITVENVILKNVKLEAEKKSIDENEEYNLTLTAYDTNDKQLDISAADIKASSDNENIVKVINTSGGIRVKGMKLGAAYINVSVSLNGIEAHTRCRVVVNPENNEIGDGWKLVSWSSKGNVSADNDEIRIIGDGKDVYGNNDAATFAYKDMESGSYSVEIEMDSLSDLNNTNTAAGLMIRTGLSDNSDNVHLRVRGDNVLLMTYRNEANKGSNVFMSDTMEFPVKIKLQKEGSTVSGYYFNDGEWKLVGSAELEETEKTYTGISIFSQTDFFADAVFRDFKINN